MEHLFNFLYTTILVFPFLIYIGISSVSKNLIKFFFPTSSYNIERFNRITYIFVYCHLSKKNKTQENDFNSDFPVKYSYLTLFHIQFLYPNERNVHRITLSNFVALFKQNRKFLFIV